MRTGELYGRRKLTKVYKHYAQFSHTRFSSLAWRGGKQLSKCLARRRAIVSRVEQIVLSRAALALYLKWCFIFNFVWKLTFFTFTRCLYKDRTPHACVIYFLWECFIYLTGLDRSRQFFRGGGVGVGWGWGGAEWFRFSVERQFFLKVHGRRGYGTCTFAPSTSS